MLHYSALKRKLLSQIMTTPSQINSSNLIWIDLEMTGLNPATDRIIEIATIVTDSNLNILAEGPVIAIHQSDELLALMDDWNKNTHGKSGLIERVRQSTVNEQQAEQQTIEFLKQWVPANSSPICGNTIGQDRRFLFNYMPNLESYFHYRYFTLSYSAIGMDKITLAQPQSASIP